MKDKKRRLEIISFYDHTGVARHLEEMAAKGWLLEKISNGLWCYRKIEPAAIRFAVTYFPKASDFDPKPSESQQTFVDYCAQSGWKLAGLSAQMQVFYNEGPNPVPIETDPVLQVENIHRAMKRNFLPANLVLLLCGLFQFGMALWQMISNPLYALFNNYTWASLVPWSLVIILTSTEIISYLRWHKKSKTAAWEEGILLPTRSTRPLQIAVLVILAIFLFFWFLSLGGGSNLIVALLSFGYMTLLFVLVFLLKSFLKKKQVRTNVNRIVTFTACFVLAFGLMALLVAAIMRADLTTLFNDNSDVETYTFKGSTFRIYQDELPLTVEDLTEIEEDARYSYYAEEKSSFLAYKLEADQSPTLDNLDPPDLTYTLIEVKFSPLYDIFRKELLTQYEYRNEYTDYHYQFVPVDPSPWKAEEAYQLCYGADSMEEYLIFWEDTLLEIHYDWQPTPEQIAITAEKLHPH
ncbi:MAG: DUF2812 domain-containing protein [Ruminiclostridium sp.]|nr:DUF2812 domain-containing protein [Ruminiclostridium sp.]